VTRAHLADVEHRTSLRSPFLGGAVDGTVATLAMSGVMLAARRIGWMGEMPPRRIARVALRRPRVGPVRRRTNDALGTAAHLLFGAALGVAFERAYRAKRRWWAGPLAGTAFGGAVWLASYGGWIPALGILPPTHRDRPGRPSGMLIAHLVYGAMLGALADRRTGGPEAFAPLGPAPTGALPATPAAY